jgi:hypothetical protein
LNWIQLAQDREEWWTFGLHKESMTILVSWVTISSSNNILHHGISKYHFNLIYREWQRRCWKSDMRQPKWCLICESTMWSYWNTQMLEVPYLGYTFMSHSFAQFKSKNIYIWAFNLLLYWARFQMPVTLI